jgi:hypothetical protein
MAFGKGSENRRPLTPLNPDFAHRAGRKPAAATRSIARARKGLRDCEAAESAAIRECSGPIVPAAMPGKRQAAAARVKWRSFSQ